MLNITIFTAEIALLNITYLHYFILLVMIKELKIPMRQFLRRVDKILFIELLFSKEKEQYWHFSRSFLEMYQILFDYDEKAISFYSEYYVVDDYDLSEQKRKKINNNDLLVINTMVNVAGIFAILAAGPIFQLNYNY